MWKSLIFTVILFVGVIAQNERQESDAFDEIKMKMDRVSADNCMSLNKDDLFLPEDAVSHWIDIKELNINPIFPNRTDMLFAHNLALSHSFFWSYILQSRFIRPAIDETYDPGMMYYFLSTVADVAANPNINASAIYFSPNSSYTSSYRGFFNETLPRFGPRTFRMKSLHDPLDAEDLGAVPEDSVSSDYTSDSYKINEWYSKWLPDKDYQKYDKKTTYLVEIHYANNTNNSFIFYGPPGADEEPGPVKFTRPYFDCGRSNKWLFAAVVPIADIYPRHTQFKHIEYEKYTAVSVVEMDFDTIDINQCPRSMGNEGPNFFAGTAKCKETTECEPLYGRGFQRGGYQCRCKPQHRLPNTVQSPYLGEILETSNNEHYNTSFDCLKINYVHKIPYNWDRAPLDIRNKYLDRYPEYRNYSIGSNSLHDQKLNVDEVLKFINGINSVTCKNYSPQELKLNNDISYKASDQFENEAKMALRLSNFISAFLQVSDPNEVYSDDRVADKPLTEDQMIGEVLSLMFGNNRIWSAGIFWEPNEFTNRTYFAPIAYKSQLNTRKLKVEDLARLNETNEIYTTSEYYRFLKQRYTDNFDDLETYKVNIKIRHNESGEFLQNSDGLPNVYKASNLNNGYWTSPKYDCEGLVKKWIITYASPFFGWDILRENLEFKGIVAVSMDMLYLDINQCPSNSDEPNAFKDSHKCDRETSHCVPIEGRGFETGGYKCVCNEGFEYPFEDHITYYDGQLVEAEFQNIVEDKQTRYDIFKCRLPIVL